MPDGPNDAVVASPGSFATFLRDALAAGTPMPVSDYYGADEALLESSAFQQEAAAAMVRAITEFVSRGP